MRRLFMMLAALICFQMVALAQGEVRPVEGDFTIRDFKFESGETLPELKLHYSTLGAPVRDSAGMVKNAVLILHGTGGTGRAFL